MRVVLEIDGAATDVEMRVADAEATVADLLAEAGCGGDGLGIFLNGRFCHPDLALAEIGLHEGASVRASRSGPPPANDARPAVLELRVVAGLEAGRRVALGPRGAIVGRDQASTLVLDDLSLSRRHCEVRPSEGMLRLTLSDLGSANGTWVSGRRIDGPVELDPGVVFEAGEVALCVVHLGTRRDRLPLDPVRHVGSGGTIAFNRPPRTRLPAAERTLSPPVAPAEAPRPRFSVVSAVGPVVLGLVMVIALRNPLYALFTLLSPVMVIGGWYESRRHARHSSRGQRREHDQAMARFRQEVAGARSARLAHLRETLPDPAEILFRALEPSVSLWERRPADDDFLLLCAGLGDLPFRPVLAERQAPSAEAEAVLVENATLTQAPAAVSLGDGGVVGIAGPRAAALAVARSLVCQAATLHGPADLMIAVLTQDDGSRDWDWAKWLPHARDAFRGGAARLLASDEEAARALAAELADSSDVDQRAVLAVLDGDRLIEGRGAVGRALLRSERRPSGIVVARSAERLPAVCTTVIELAEGTAEATLRRPQLGDRIDPLLIAGVSGPTARECALGLSRFEDADMALAGGSLPESVSLLGLLSAGDLDPPSIVRRWQVSGQSGGLGLTLGWAEDGPFELDLVRDGPHGLIAGTTGSGKSELLRTLVASLSIGHDPTALNFVLVDYKGGSAFAECAQLPHTVGMVTDLDEQLGERALRSLEAELRHRERVLREHRATDLDDYSELVRRQEVPPLPRLLVIIDEFATLAAELPDFVASLVGIAQRGRSLGVHLLLATQRPSGAVNENIRANANLRICLRVQTAQDSTDVIGSPTAATIGRDQAGRAQVRLGPSELRTIQTAMVSGRTSRSAERAIELIPFAFAADTERDRSDGGAAEASDLSRLVAGVKAAADSQGEPPPRRPWLEPLPERVTLGELTELGPARPLAEGPGTVVALALADDPAAQSQYPVGWCLGAGNLLLYGIGGSGTTTALAAVAISLAGLLRPDRLHLYVIDFGSGELRPLADLPHVGAVIETADHERQRRLLRWLVAELDRRRRLPAADRAAAPVVVLLLDGYAAFASEHRDAAGDAFKDELARVWSDGPDLGVHVATSADRAGAVPQALASLARQRLAFRFADVADYAQFGVHRRDVPRFTAGRAVVGGSGQVVQVALPGPSLSAAVGRLTAELGDAPGGPSGIGVLPDAVSASDLAMSAASGWDPWCLPIGIGDDMLEPVGLLLYEGEHALVAGPGRSGKTTLLLAVAEVAARREPDLSIVGVALRRSALRDCPHLQRLVTTPDDLAALVANLGEGGRKQLVLIDDAEAVDDQSRALGDLLARSPATMHAVVAGRSDALRSLGHWTTAARRAKAGVLLMPDVHIDGTLLGVTLPRRQAAPPRAGRGYLVDGGRIELVQTATPAPVGERG